ncbi:MAG TPA: hypothetical protein VK035_01840 [Kiloniellales bacterium]|nr:hypothetical protein [Kiloniellales bacterium]
MLYVDIPTPSEIVALNKVRARACVSIYVRTTPVTQQVEGSRIEFGNLAREARQQLEAIDHDKREVAAIMEQLEELEGDRHYWAVQAHSLVVLATPDSLRTFRLANKLESRVEVSDRFHLKPLFRAITFPHSAFILALSANAARLIEVHADLPPSEVKVEDLPDGAFDFQRDADGGDRRSRSKAKSLEVQNIRLQQYARSVDTALRAVLVGRETPLILAATGRLASVFRAVNSYPNLLEEGIDGSPDRVSDAELAAAARPLLDAFYEEKIEKAKALFEARVNEGRAITDISDAARAATFGVIDTLLVNMDSTVPGSIDENTGRLTFAEEGDATAYGVVDEIAGRALEHGARVLAVRQADLPGQGELAAILRYAP